MRWVKQIGLTLALIGGVYLTSMAAAPGDQPVQAIFGGACLGLFVSMMDWETT